MQRKILVLLSVFLFCFSSSAVAQNISDKPLKILSKPRPSYTYAARNNNVQGIVRVKVEFLADGTIGKVTDVSENSEDARRFGLVEECIKVARKVKFEPQIKDGKPITVSKKLEYSFAIY